MNILSAITDRDFLRPFVSNRTDKLATWSAWRDALAALYGLPVKSPQLLKQCTERSAKKLPSGGFDEALFLTGRRSGKSRMAATIAAFEGAISGRHKRLNAGEAGVIPIISPTLKQSRVVHEYVREAFELSPLLRGQIVEEQKNSFELQNGVRIETIAGDWRSVRGYTLLCVILDEAAFFGMDDQSRVRTDTELVRALTPGLATTGGKLIAISSPYGRFGWCFKTYENSFGSDDADTLVWNAPSRVMNTTLRQSVVDKAMRADPASAKAEYMAEFRDDVAAFVTRDVVMACVNKDRWNELLPKPQTRYAAFADLSGGRNDDATFAIAHREGDTPVMRREGKKLHIDREGGRIVIDCVHRFRPPFVPRDAIRSMAKTAQKYKVARVFGDQYAGEFVPSAFSDFGVKYEPIRMSKNELYINLLPMLTGREVELPDNAALIDQLTRLERRTRSGGRDIIDHPRGGHDDLANVVAGAVASTAIKTVAIGGF